MTAFCCNEHPYGCPEGGHTAYRITEPPFFGLSKSYPGQMPDSEEFTWPELERLELRTRRTMESLDALGSDQMYDLWEGLADALELLAAMVHHRESQDESEPEPGSLVYARDRKREWSENEITDLVGQTTRESRELTNQERVTGRPPFTVINSYKKE